MSAFDPLRVALVPGERLDDAFALAAGLADLDCQVDVLARSGPERARTIGWRDGYRILWFSDRAGAAGRAAYLFWGGVRYDVVHILDGSGPRRWRVRAPLLISPPARRPEAAADCRSRYRGLIGQ